MKHEDKLIELKKVVETLSIEQLKAIVMEAVGEAVFTDIARFYPAQEESAKFPYWDAGGDVIGGKLMSEFEYKS
jgi:hypothetical protein